MDNKKSPKGRKRSAKGGSSIAASIADENFWDCSVCTFRNNAEAFKCSMCDVRKGTSTRKPRLNPDLVAQQQAQALTPPPASLLAGSSGTPGPSSSGVKSPASVEDEDIGEEEDEDESDLAALASLKANKRLSKEKPPKEKKKESKKPINKAKLRNVDRNSATYHSVTVNDFTVVITEFKPKIKKEKEKKESKSHGSTNPTSTNSSSSSPTSSAANTPAPAGIPNDKQLNGNNSSNFDAALHGSTNINSAKTLGISGVDQSKNRIPSPNDQGMELSDEIKDRQPVLAAALQSPLKYSGSSTKLNNLGSPKNISTDPEKASHISSSRPPAISSTHYPHGGVHHPRPHPHHHQVSPNPNKAPGNDRHPIPGFPHARPSQTPSSSLPSSNKPAPIAPNPTNNIKGSSSITPSGPTSRASTGSSSTTSSSTLSSSISNSNSHKHSSSSGNSANGSMTSPKNSNMSRNN